MKGSKCKCGFATTSFRTRCPRCGKEMKTSEWEERGKVLSFLELQMTPQGFDGPRNMALVEIEGRGPKIICWTLDTLKDEEDVSVNESDGQYICSASAKPKDKNSS